MAAPALVPDASLDCSTLADGATHDVSTNVQGTARDYLIHAPRSTGATRLPVLIAYHGRTQTPEMIEAYSGLSQLPAIVVYPRGLPGAGGKTSWSGMPTAPAGIDDVAFSRAIIARVGALACADPARVYLTGKSDGGSIAVEVACAAADLVRGVASIAGAYYPIAGGCTPARPLSILEFHGLADTVIPYDGNVERKLPPVPEWLAQWARRDDCATAGAYERVAGGVDRAQWSGCANGVRVVAYRIADGGHTWPGALVDSGPGPTTHAISATDILAAFFGIGS